MNTENGNAKYAAQRALLELDARRESGDWAGDTATFPALDPVALAAAEALEATLPNTPALVRRQAG